MVGFSASADRPAPAAFPSPNPAAPAAPPTTVSRAISAPDLLSATAGTAPATAPPATAVGREAPPAATYGAAEPTTPATLPGRLPLHRPDVRQQQQYPAGCPRYRQRPSLPHRIASSRSATPERASAGQSAWHWQERHRADSIRTFHPERPAPARPAA
ncbi:conserved hypothetical protein [Ricinus communis]|uniref:Uncharacterized protein n=1 Tax=Ricinus communis TaxID=3988 RepID=B9TLM7_RICCO|nr:conserved hypothetical protein [Ricinus communis]